MIQVLPRSESLEMVLATWRTPPDDTYRLPEVEPFEACECEEDWHIPIAESQRKGRCGCKGSGCGGSCEGCANKPRASRGGGDRRRRAAGGVRSGVSVGAMEGSSSAGEAAGRTADLLEPDGFLSEFDGLLQSSGLKSTPPNEWRGFGDPPPTPDDYTDTPEHQADVALFNEAIRLNLGESGREWAEDVASYWDVPVPALGTLAGAKSPPTARCPEGAPLQPPPFESVADYTQRCFGSSPEWPPLACEAPCIAPRACKAPDLWQRLAAELVMPTVVADNEDHRLSDDPEDPFVLEEELTGDEAIFLAAAKALLLENLDLVEWVVCFACYAADVPDPQHIINCILDGLTGGARRYLYAIDSFTGRGKGGPTGAATDIFAPADGGTGVVVPIRHPVWRDAVAAYTAAIDAGDDVSAMAAASAMSNNILHELMHLCTSELGEPALADDGLSCWAIQNMVGISFIWALAQRYPCLQGLDCLPKADDYYFMTSEPEGGEEIFPWDASKPVCGRRG